LARGLIKHPDLLVINAATAVFDGSAQARVLGRMLEDRKGQGVVWVLDREDFLDKFDRVLALRDGKIVESTKNLAAE
jgi:ABC-type transport system involved in cytochrome bd biosynthesis fused ATPase/permease subunit